MANRGLPLCPHNEIFCIHDLKEKGSKKLPRIYQEYYNHGSMDMLTLRDNETAFDRFKIRPRILRDVSNIDPSTTVCGRKVAFPFGFSPAAAHKIAHVDGEVGTSRAAAAQNIPMGLSAYATTSLEDVISVGRDNPYFMQINFLMDKKLMKSLLHRAEVAGYHAVILTVDAPMYGIRLNEGRNNFGMPDGIEYPNLAPGMDMSSLAKENDPLAYDPSVTWENAVRFMRESTKLPIWIKGVYTPEDVELAIEHGLDGVIISNHGGRQLDSVPATIDALRECAPVAKGRIPIAIDGGIRRGTDIFKAVALGADLCFAGRIPIWGLAWNGTDGVELSIKLLYREFEKTMGLAGVSKVDEISPAHLSVFDHKGALAKL
ncbi:FMN-dependent dehydrogenase family protein [Dactylonectria macrodidyma]|uniref:Oxidase FUB9 n=1 Tax=Dactylonectria macrodidyma TaxID=307937 RepID=A0A9P9JQ11_9HYPO|nr:FMN-dependent dehydrogenase family protein [Dactylonectria macrodidyma]